eukprot:3941542-Rhodomonas_salina.2
MGSGLRGRRRCVQLAEHSKHHFLREDPVPRGQVPFTRAPSWHLETEALVGDVRGGAAVRRRMRSRVREAALTSALDTRGECTFKTPQISSLLAQRASFLGDRTRKGRECRVSSERVWRRSEQRASRTFLRTCSVTAPTTSSVQTDLIQRNGVGWAYNLQTRLRSWACVSYSCNTVPQVWGQKGNAGSNTTNGLRL